MFWKEKHLIHESSACSPTLFTTSLDWSCDAEWRVQSGEEAGLVACSCVHSPPIGSQNCIVRGRQPPVTTLCTTSVHHCAHLCTSVHQCAPLVFVQFHCATGLSLHCSVLFSNVLWIGSPNCTVTVVHHCTLYTSVHRSSNCNFQWTTLKPTPQLLNVCTWSFCIASYYVADCTARNKQ